MYIARFSYSIKPVDRAGPGAARAGGGGRAWTGPRARLLVPLTRPQGGPALQYELVLPNLDAFREEEEWAGRTAPVPGCVI